MDSKTKRHFGASIICFNVVFVIATAVYLFGVDTEKECRPLVDDQPDNYVNVDRQFNQVLILIFTSHLVGLVQGILYVIERDEIANFLSIAWCIELAGFIMLHVVRFRYYGKVCAGDAIVEDINQ